MGGGGGKELNISFCTVPGSLLVSSLRDLVMVRMLNGWISGPSVKWFRLIGFNPSGGRHLLF